MNDYRPVALTSVAMKVFERIVLRYLKEVTGHLFDPFQFAYQANRSVDNAVSLGLNFILQHLEKPRSYARVLFVDYSSAFNTIIPHKLFDKLSGMNVHSSICHWVLDFLLDRPQVVKFQGFTSGSVTLNTGAPQGCVLSPFLFVLFTNDCVSQDPSVNVIKFSDDTTIEGLIQNDNEERYREEVRRLAAWCSDNDLELNVSKTKEVIIDFRRSSHTPDPLMINGQLVEQVSSFKFLGTVISDDLKWDTNINSIVKKCHQRLHFLRQLKKFRLSTSLLLRFYSAVIESILSFSITVWYGNASQEDKDKLDKIVKKAEKIVGCALTPLDVIYESRVLGRSKKIMKDQSHPANHLFELLPSGKRYRSIACKTNRLKNSLYPSAIRLLNDNRVQSTE